MDKMECNINNSMIQSNFFFNRTFHLTYYKYKKLDSKTIK